MAFSSRSPIDVDGALQTLTAYHRKNWLDNLACLYQNTDAVTATSSAKDTILSLTGPGYVSFLGMGSPSTINDHINMDIIIDGVSWINEQRLFTSPTHTSRYSQVIGCLKPVFFLISVWNYLLEPDPVYFSSSFVIKLWTSVGNSVSVTWWIDYEVQT